DDDRAVTEGRLDLRAAGRFELASVIAVDVVRILQDVAGENRDDIGIARNYTRGGEFANSRERRRRGWLAADAAQSNDRLRVGDLLLGHDFNDSTRGRDLT